MKRETCPAARTIAPVYEGVGAVLERFTDETHPQILRTRLRFFHIRLAPFFV
jgi:hypothetical protein